MKLSSCESSTNVDMIHSAKGDDILTPNSVFEMSFVPFLKNSEFADITLHILNGKGEEFRCHKIILAAASSFFSELFCNNGWLDSIIDAYYVDLPVSVISFEKMLRFIYGEAIDITSDTIFEYLYLASYFSVETLYKRIETFLASEINVDNMFLMASISESFCLSRLQARTVAYVAENLIELDHFDSKALKYVGTDCIVNLLKKKAIYSRSEDQIFNLVDIFIKSHHDLSFKQKSLIINLLEPSQLLKTPNFSFQNLLTKCVKVNRFACGAGIDWTIHSWSSITAKSLRSPSFKDIQGSEWNLLVYPKGPKKTHVAVYLYAKGTYTTRSARFKVKILNHKNYSDSIGFESVIHQWDRSNHNWGWSTLIPYDQITSESGFLIDDKVIFRVRVSKMV
eukprot:TRINITY_DN2447_c1_g1_i1.p1 TRINITY_DN2447_c1_g1~~TRINITY_DN2447_c1_g1_i1.p1  ORF type:complete len:395 (-),score=68.45 TRINITY_DN2447_c1_g1_i1:90-1274(-)